MIFWWSWAQIFRRIQGTFILTIHMTESLPAFYFITPVAWIWCFSSQNWTCFHFTVNWYRKSINWCIKIVHQRNEHHVLRLHFVHLIQQNSRRLELSVRFFQLKKLTGATCNLCLTVQMTGVQTTNPEDWFDVGQQVIIKSSLQRSFKHFYHKITTAKISKCYNVLHHSLNILTGDRCGNNKTFWFCWYTWGGVRRKYIIDNNTNDR